MITKLEHDIYIFVRFVYGDQEATFLFLRLAPARAVVCGHLPSMRIIGSPATLLLVKVLGSHSSVSGRLRLITC